MGERMKDAHDRARNARNALLMAEAMTRHHIWAELKNGKWVLAWDGTKVDGNGLRASREEWTRRQNYKLRTLEDDDPVQLVLSAAAIIETPDQGDPRFPKTRQS